ncbi:erythromycin esterase family protein [Halorussus lipolyticus]|uniref:erythromycin esterase family protein n=1 Tax=Halorussus lipolyticus TaxID=3034024 RepID=UPI0023E86CAD|nr:erythromycin esterase family protein [Halorussus sp. DT80]
MTGDDVAAALADYAVPVSAGQATPAEEDAPSSEPAADLLADAAVVGLGEATHGTRECFRAKHRLIRSLVERHGFRTVAFEAGVAAMLPADGYVRGGDDGTGECADAGIAGWRAESPDEALAKLDKWMWQTDEVRDLLSWLRSFNEGRPPGDRVRVRGIDLGDPAEPASRLQSYLAAVDPAYAAEADELVSLVDFDASEDDAASDRRLDEATDAARSLADRLDQRRESYVEERSSDEWGVARHLCRVVEHTCEWHRVRHEHEGPHPAGMAERDRLMAGNAACWKSHDPGEGVVIWAHNSHVQRGTFDDGQVWTDAETMGEELALRFGDRYRPVGFDFARGSFRAIPAGSSGGSDPRVFSVDDPLDASATARLDALDAESVLLDVSSAADDPRLEDWFDRPRRLRWVGTVYDPDADPAAHYMRTDLPASFDALIFLGKSTPTRPLDCA